MSEAYNSTEVEKISISEGVRIVLRKDFYLPIAEITEKVKQMVGKAPSRALVYQLKNKLKIEAGSKTVKSKTTKVELKLSKKKNLKKVVNLNNSSSSETFKFIHSNNVNASGIEFTKVAAKLTKIRQYIEEFGSKEELIGWANLI